MTPTVQPYRFGRVHVMPAQRRLLVDGRSAPLGARAFDLLLALIERRDRVVSGVELIDLIWPGLVVEENNLRQQVAALRKVLGAEAVVTVPGRGYRFTLTPDEQDPQPFAVAATSHAAVTHNLPLNLPTLIGRERELATVTDLLARSNLVTLVGVGGVGKTRFALELAGNLRSTYKDGGWFVDLAPVADAARVAQEVASVLDVHEEPGRPLLDTLLEYLRRHELLIVLDNCEHLVESCAYFAATVLHSSATTRILATSREALGIVGELTWPMPTLSVADPDAHLLPEQLMRYAATQLFVQRAIEAAPKFELTAANVGAVARLCHQLDGMPLALELAAARVRAMRVEQVADRLSDRFALLTRGSRTALPRHQTLRALVDWSHELLSATERVLLRRLSVFAGGWTLEAAEAVCSGEGLAAADVLDALTLLVEKSMVLLDEQARQPRYRMLETIRQYAREKLVEAGETALAGHRHLAYVLNFAEAAEPHFFHPDQLQWYARADTELDNVRAALEWSLAQSQVKSGMRLANALHRYWVARLYWREATAWFERLVAMPEVDPRSALRAKTLYVSGHITNYYDSTAAKRLTDESLRLSRAIDFSYGIVNALWVLGWICNPRLDGSAAPLYEESIALASSTDYPWGAAHAYAWYGMYKVAMGEYEAAKPLLLMGIECANRLGGDVSLIGRCKGNLGQAEMLAGNFTQAHLYLDESLALTRQADNRNGIAESLWLQGRLALRERNMARAMACLKESLALYRPYATSVWVTRGLAYLMIVYSASNQVPLAATLAGALAARDGRTGCVKVDLGSLAAIAEYDAAVAEVHHLVAGRGLGAAWDEGMRLNAEAAVALALR